MLKQYSAIKGTLSWQGIQKSLRFLPSGSLTVNNGTFRYLSDNKQQQITIIINRIGRVRLQQKMP